MYVVNGSTAMLYGAVLVMSNRAEYGAGVYASNDVYVSVLPTNMLSAQFVGNRAEANGGGMYINDGSRASMVNPGFIGNTASNIGGGLYVLGSTVDVHGVTYNGAIRPPSKFVGNVAGYGGAVEAVGPSDVTLGESLIVSNRSVLGAGGACVAFLGALVQLQNTVVAHNWTAIGAAIDCGFVGRFVLTECTVAHNATNGIRAILGGTAELTNSIVWGHTGVELVPVAQAVYCDVEGGHPGMGNFSADPLFVNTNALDYRLSVGSPCVDTGTPVFLTYDAIGNPRPIGAGYDVGAFEQNPVPLQTVMPNLLYFGELVPGESTNRNAVVSNIGFATLTGTVTSVLGPVFSVASVLPYVAGAQATDVVTFTFAPLIDGITWTNFVQFVSNGGTNDVTLIGTGVPEPAALAALAAAITAVIRARRALS
jgi:hypothetical protein